MSECNSIEILCLKSTQLSLNCNAEKSNKYLSSGLPTTNRLEQLTCGRVFSCCAESLARTSTGLGAAIARFTVICKLAEYIDFIELGRSVFCRVSDGTAWRSFDGAIEQAIQQGNYWRLVINPGIKPLEVS